MEGRRRVGAGRAPASLAHRLIGHRPWACAAALGAALAGCGYRPLGTEALPPNVRSVAIGPIANTTFRPGLQGFLGDLLYQRLRGDGRVEVRPSPDADAVLETVISGYGAEGVAWDRDGVARRFRVQVTAGITLRDRQTYQVLISDGVVGEAYYTAGAGVGATLAAEEEATRRAVRDLAERVANRIIEGL